MRMPICVVPTPHPQSTPNPMVKPVWVHAGAVPEITQCGRCCKGVGLSVPPNH